MSSKPSRADALAPELAAQSERWHARRAALAAGARSPRLTTDALDAGRAALRQGRSGLDLAIIERVRRPS